MENRRKKGFQDFIKKVGDESDKMKKVKSVKA